MDENTKAIVASNLTVAYFTAKSAEEPSGRAKLYSRGSSYSEEEVLETFRRFRGKLDEGEAPEFVGVPPHTGGES